MKKHILDRLKNKFFFLIVWGWKSEIWVPAWVSGFLVRTVLLNMCSHGFALVHGERKKGRRGRGRSYVSLHFYKDINPTISEFFTPQDHIPNPITYKDSIFKCHRYLGLQAAPSLTFSLKQLQQQTSLSCLMSWFNKASMLEDKENIEGSERWLSV